MKQLLLFLTLVLSLTGFSQTNWTLSNAGMLQSGYSDFAIAPNGDVYAVGAYQTWNSYEPMLYKSTDNGNNWTEVNMTIDNDVTLPQGLIFSGNRLLMCTKMYNGDYKVFGSTDFGQNWILSNTGMPTGAILSDFAAGPDGYVYLAGTKPTGTFNAPTPMFLKSSNDGTSWGETPNSGIVGTTESYAIIFDAYGKMYFSGGSSIVPNQLYTSTDKGVTWTDAYTGVPSTCTIRRFTLGNGQEVYATGTDDAGSGYVPRIMKSTNFGASWTNISGLTGLTNVIGAASIINVRGTLLLSDYSYNSSYVHRSMIPTAAALVLTSPVTSVTDVSARTEGQVFQDGGTPVTARGICWSTSPSPTIADEVMNLGFGTGTFSTTIDGLMPLTTYYIRAFATNSVTTAYGSQKSFTTAVSSGIQSAATEADLAAYPVPASDVIYVPVKASPAVAVYTVFDGAGKSVLTTRLEAGKNTIDISNLPKGCYFLQSDDGRKQQFIKD